MGLTLVKAKIAESVLPKAGRSETFSLVCVLHNIEIDSPFEIGPFALVPRNDPRMRSILSRSPTARALFENLTDQFGQARRPTGLIMPSSMQKVDPAHLIAFRNVFAISCLMNARQFAAVSQSAFQPMFSDSFDLYPLSPSVDDQSFIIHTPALSGIARSPDKLQAQTSPGLPTGGFYEPQSDPDVCRDLTWMFERLLSRKRPRRSERILFRSLEMAYQALAMPSANLSSLHDHGTRIGLWVSAFEILAHPWRGRAGLETVVELLERARWNERRLASRTFIVSRRGWRRRVTFATRVYEELYNARNDFFHGNEVRKGRLNLFKNTRRPPLEELAPLVYGVALTTFIAAVKHWKGPSSRLSLLKLLQRSFGSQGDLETALSRALGLRGKSGRSAHGLKG